MLVARRATGRDVGYAAFKRTHKWPNSRPAADGRGVPALPARLRPGWRCSAGVVDLDLAGTVKINGIAPGRPDAVVGRRARAASSTMNPYDSLWVRLVDLPAALAARGYEGGCDVVVEVDRRAPRRGTPGAGGSGSRTAPVRPRAADDDAEVSLPVAALGAAYLGGANLAEMARARRGRRAPAGRGARAVARLPHRRRPVRRPRLLTDPATG